MTVFSFVLQGTSLAHIAAMAPDTAILRLLMERGIRLNVRDKHGNHPIHWAAMEGRLDNLKLLVEEAGVNPKQRNAEGGSPLDIAAVQGLLPIVRYLIEERGMDPTRVHAKVCPLRRSKHVF